MIGKVAKYYCKDITKIENYGKAVVDTTQIWDCHHRLETHYLMKGKWVEREEELTRDELLKENKLYNVPPEELIFLTRSEHKSLHKKSMQKATDSSLDIISKPVLCIETGQIFESTREAENKTGIKHQNIGGVCCGKRKSAGGYHWTYVD